jgi:hypothetical protein
VVSRDTSIPQSPMMISPLTSPVRRNYAYLVQFFERRGGYRRASCLLVEGGGRTLSLPGQTAFEILSDISILLVSCAVFVILIPRN